MNAIDRELLDQFYRHEITQDEFASNYAEGIAQDWKHFEKLLNDALVSKDGSDLEDAMTIGGLLNLWDQGIISIFNTLLLEDWHQEHENIAMSLEIAKDPSSIEALYKAALKRFEYLDYDDGFELASKCIWALSEINTKESIDKLKLLAESKNPVIGSYAIAKLSEN